MLKKIKQEMDDKIKKKSDGAWVMDPDNFIPVHSVPQDEQNRNLLRNDWLPDYVEAIWVCCRMHDPNFPIRGKGRPTARDIKNNILDLRLPQYILAFQDFVNDAFWFFILTDRKIDRVRTRKGILKDVKSEIIDKDQFMPAIGSSRLPAYIVYPIFNSAPIKNVQCHRYIPAENYGKRYRPSILKFMAIRQKHRYDKEEAPIRLHRMTAKDLPVPYYYEG